MAEDGLLVERAGGILTLTLNRPASKNAITGDMVVRLAEEVTNAGVDDETRVVVLRAAGDDFCTGMDIVGPNQTPREGSYGGEATRPPKPRLGHLQRSFQVGPHRMIAAMEQAQVPIVAGVRGWAAGFGNALALSADFVVASPTAMFWVPFVTKGFTPDSGTSWILPRLVGLARAKEMVLRGRPIDGETAAAWGLISQCVPDDELDSTVDALVSELAEAATTSVGFAKLLLHRNLDVSLSAALAIEGVTEELGVRSDDFKEGMKAFIEKRPPSYSGR